MREERYLPKTQGGKWAISREVFGTYVHLVEHSYLDDESKIEHILLALKIPPTSSAINYYFPENGNGKRCPTTELMERFALLPPGTGKAIGV